MPAKTQQRIIEVARQDINAMLDTLKSNLEPTPPPEDERTRVAKLMHIDLDGNIISGGETCLACLKRADYHIIESKRAVLAALRHINGRSDDFLDGRIRKLESEIAALEKGKTE